jgi:hypothetical protein
MDDKQGEKLPCRWRLDGRFMYECKVCHNRDQTKCPNKPDDDEEIDYTPYQYMGGGS